MAWCPASLWFVPDAAAAERVVSEYSAEPVSGTGSG